MSESTAGKRIGAARTARRFPVVFDMVARGDIHLSGLHRLKAHLTPENHAHVLAEAKHKTIRQIEQLVARLAPQADVPSTLRALPRRPATSVPALEPAASAVASATSVAAPATSAAPVVPSAPAVTAPGPGPALLPPSPRSPDPVRFRPGAIGCRSPSTKPLARSSRSFKIFSPTRSRMATPRESSSGHSTRC